MLLIQSKDSDPSTDGVLAWLNYLYPEQEYNRINNNKEIGEISYLIHDDANILEFTVNDFKFSNKEIVNRWYRRGSINTSHLTFQSESVEELSISLAIEDYLKRELKSLNAEVDNYLSSANNSINKFSDNEKGKLENALMARRAGLNIPPTLFTNDISKLLQFTNEHEKIITKANHHNRFQIDLGDSMISMGFDTRLWTKADVEKLIADDPIARFSIPSFFQKYIEKRYELRIFFLDGEFYSMAIFSQENEKTKVDYRNYDRERPNRCVPYTLPETVQTKLSAFMKLSDMNCGSIDMIYSTDGAYIFLEVNPVGQFHWLDKHCNYFLEREIAKFLCDERK